MSGINWSQTTVSVFLQGVIKRPVDTGWRVFCDWCDDRAECDDSIPDGWLAVSPRADLVSRYCCPKCRKTELPSDE